MKETFKVAQKDFLLDPMFTLLKVGTDIVGQEINQTAKEELALLTTTTYCDGFEPAEDIAN